MFRICLTWLCWDARIYPSSFQAGKRPEAPTLPDEAASKTGGNSIGKDFEPCQLIFVAPGSPCWWQQNGHSAHTRMGSQQTRGMNHAHTGMRAGGQPVRNPFWGAGSNLLTNTICTVFVTGSNEHSDIQETELFLETNTRTTSALSYFLIHTKRTENVNRRYLTYQSDIFLTWFE